MRTEKLQSVPLNSIRIDDAFWNRYTRLVTKEIIPYQWKALNDEVEDAEPSHCISNFQIAAGLKKGKFEGWVFQDTDLAKWLEAVAYSLSYEPNAELERLADEAIALVGKAQEENGYLDTYFSILEPGRQFKNLKEGHELYTAGHFIEAAVAYYRVTGKDALLNIMRKNADLICEIFHTPRYENAVPGHEEIELALVKLAEATGEKKYLDMARDFINRRGTEPNYLATEGERDDFVDVWHDPNPYVTRYGQAHLPVREQTTAEGHAVRAVYLYCGMADIAYAYCDEGLFAACERLYGNITQKRMYITGGIGSSGVMERFTTDYDLPNDSAYAESCASIGLALFCRRMAQITGDAKYVGTMELALMNTVLSGIAMDGKSFFYVNPLEVWPDNCMPATSMSHIKPVRQKWFGCACCPPNIARTLASLGEYACFAGAEGLWINLFAGGHMKISLGGRVLSVEMRTKFPWEGRFALYFSEEKGDGAKTAEPSDLRLRIPSYAENPAVTVDGVRVDISMEKGYAVLKNTWGNQTVELTFDMPARFVRANKNVRKDIGKVAVMKGPVVYCLEEEDNGSNLSALYADASEPLRELYDEKLLGGVVTVTAKGWRVADDGCEDGALYGTGTPSLVPAKLTFVPYANWGNRRAGEMSVWVKERRS